MSSAVSEASIVENAVLVPQKGRAASRKIVNITTDLKRKPLLVKVTYQFGSKNRLSYCTMDELLDWSKKYAATVTPPPEQIRPILTLKRTPHTMSVNIAETIVPSTELDDELLVSKLEFMENYTEAAPVTQEIRPIEQADRVMQHYFQPNERVMLYIDNSALYAATRALNFDLEYRSLRQVFIEACNLLRVEYYMDIFIRLDRQGQQEHTPLIPLANWLKYNGFSVHANYIDRSDNNADHDKIAATQMLPDMLIAAYTKRVDHIVLLAGSASYIHTLEHIKRMGVRVTVISTLLQRDPDTGETYDSVRNVSNKLRQTADQFLDLAQLQPYITRPPKQT